MYSMLSTPFTWVSIGAATDCATVSASAPGKLAETVTVGGAIGGYCSMGRPTSAASAVVAAATLITGIGKVVGLETVRVEGATGSLDSNLEGKVRAVIDALATHVFVLLNIKGADESGHDAGQQ